MKVSLKVSALLLFLVGGLLLPGPATATTEPAGFEYFHTYAENEQLIDDAVAAHPAIAAKFSIGRSYEGREIWGIKISDNVAQDENEPEVFIHGLTHARERASNEMALYLIQMLTDEYATNSRIKAIVDSREIWIVPMLNPDGAEFDMSGGHWHKMAQEPTADPRLVGDRHRSQPQLGLHVGRQRRLERQRQPRQRVLPRLGTRGRARGAGLRGIRGQPSHRRPSSRFSASIGFHSAARQVCGRTLHEHGPPPDMSADDHAALVALGENAAAVNGYKPQQGSDLYPVHGDQDDWAYHDVPHLRLHLRDDQGFPEALLPDAGRAECRTSPPIAAPC